MELIVLAISCFLLVLLIILVYIFRPKQNQEILLGKLTAIEAGLEKLEENFRNDFKLNREEMSKGSSDSRAELSLTLKDFKIELNNTLGEITKSNQFSLTAINLTLDSKLELLTSKIEENNKSNREEFSQNLRNFTQDQKSNFESFDSSQKSAILGTNQQLEKISSKIEEHLTALSSVAKEENKNMREELDNSFKGFQSAFDRNVESFNNLQKEKFAQLEIKQAEMISNTEAKLNLIKSTVEEKLEKTLSDRIGQSFETVGKQLIEVQKGLGEMQTLAQDVGGLKKVLSNVKMRGGLGEAQLEMLLENLLAPDQYGKNVKTKDGSGSVVEFAIKLPGKTEAKYIWLPIDAKFPKDVYEQLQNAHDSNDLNRIEIAQKLLETTLKTMAKDIFTKYVDPPNTTDFAIMFLPFEGIFAEVVRKASLLEEIQRNYKVIVTGPTTLAAILSSLQMGFKTLAIEKRSSEVWTTLGAVKQEFETFGGMLSKAQAHFRTGMGQLDDVVGVRTRAIQKKLSSVESLAVPAPAIVPAVEMMNKLTTENDDEDVN